MKPPVSSRPAVLLLFLSLSHSAHSASGPCVDPPAGKYGRWDGTQVCFHDEQKTKRASVTAYEDGKEIGPSRNFREDGSLERVSYFRPNVGPYTTEEHYYETGGIRRVQFSSSESTVILEYAVSGRLHKVTCLPGVNGGYGYSLDECQGKVAFDIKKWRPAK